MLQKITIILLFIIFISINKVSFSAETKCPIESKTPDVLSNYIKNVRTIEKNMLSSLSDLKMKNYNGKIIDATDYRSNLEINPINKKDLDKVIPFIRGESFKISDRVTYFFNESSNWNGFRAETVYYGLLAIFQEIPPSIDRDFNLLKNESKRIDRRLNYLIKRGFYNGIVDSKKLCDGVIGVCFFPENGTIGDAYTILKNNNNKIEDIIMLSLNGKLDTFLTSIPNKNVGSNLFLVKTNFLDEISKYYNKNTFTDCSINGNVWSWFKDAWEQIKRASDNAKMSDDTIKEWKEAMELAKGMPNEKKKYEEQERKILERELARNGLNTNASRAILNNLKRFNEKGWYSMENNFITNTIVYGIENIKREVSRFDLFWEGVTRTNKEIITPLELTKTNKRLAKSIELEKEIIRIYERAEPFTQINLEQDEKIKSKFRVAYLNLRTTIENLHEVEDMACKVCEDQMQNIKNDFCCPKDSKIK